MPIAALTEPSVTQNRTGKGTSSPFRFGCYARAGSEQLPSVIVLHHCSRNGEGVVDDVAFMVFVMLRRLRLTLAVGGARHKDLVSDLGRLPIPMPEPPCVTVGGTAVISG